VLDLSLGLKAGPEPEPEAGYSTASRRGSLARTRNAMLLFRQRARRPASDPGHISTRQPRRLVTYLALYRSTEQLSEICSRNYTVCAGRIVSHCLALSRIVTRER